MKIGSASCSAGKGNWMNCHTYSDRPKHKSLARKWTCRSNSLSSCTQKSELAQVSQSKSEMAPSGGEIPPSLPSRVTQVGLVDQTPQTDTNGSMSYLHRTNICRESLAKSADVMTHEQAGIEKDTSHSETVKERNVFSGNNLSENEEEESLPAQSFSPARKLQRRVRIYKRKRRKTDTNAECVKQNDVPDSSILRLLEIFQSSDDMDLEFHGFLD